MSKKTSPAVEVAREQQQTDDGIITLSTGARVRIKPVAASLITEAQFRVPLPPVPKFKHPDDDREYENPDSPVYKVQLAQAQQERAIAANDAAILFGVELVDPIPDDGWERRLELAGFKADLSDDIGRDFAYKKYVAVAAQDIQAITAAMAPTQEALDKAEATFPGNA